MDYMDINEDELFSESMTPAALVDGVHRELASEYDELAELICPGSSITKLQLLSVTMAFTIKHHLTKSSCQDLLTLINELVPNSVPGTSYLFS